MTKWEKASSINAMAINIDEEKSKEIAEFAINMHRSELRESGHDLEAESWQDVKQELKFAEWAGDNDWEWHPNE